jgi:hypothetical protein
MFTVDGCTEAEAEQFIASLMGWVAPNNSKVTVSYELMKPRRVRPMIPTHFKQWEDEQKS